ncbi:MAG: nicotinamide mononucleotide transporter [Bacteroidales bacterium]|nr:nicotinamide mononucleotide transporter [Bacteroidales bacterium]
MIQAAAEWLSANLLEVAGSLLGLAYIILGVRQNILTWPAGIISSLLYIFIFLDARFYANMGLQFYYTGMSIYGWYFWLRGKKEEPGGQLPVTHLSLRQGGAAAAIALPLFGGIYLLLHHHTDSPIPFMDAFIATLGIIATWMLARKILFNWIIWIVSDSCAVILYISRDMWPTALLYVIYLGMAFYGYFSWKRSINHRTS